MKKEKSSDVSIQTMDNYTADDVTRAFPPIESLISKSEKAQQKLAPGTWQHSMLRNNLNALHIAYALMNKDIADKNTSSQDNLKEALKTLNSLMIKVEKAKAKFSEGTSQHTLQRNRLKSLQIASAFIKGVIKEN